MKKMKYEEPSTRVVVTMHRAQLLAGSVETSGSIGFGSDENYFLQDGENL